MKLKITLEIEVDEAYGETAEEIEWMELQVLDPDRGLTLWSNEVGDSLGEVKKVEKIEWIK